MNSWIYKHLSARTRKHISRVQVFRCCNSSNPKLKGSKIYMVRSKFCSTSLCHPLFVFVVVLFKKKKKKMPIELSCLFSFKILQLKMFLSKIENKRGAGYQKIVQYVHETAESKALWIQPVSTECFRLLCKLYFLISGN